MTFSEKQGPKKQGIEKQNTEKQNTEKQNTDPHEIMNKLRQAEIERKLKLYEDYYTAAKSGEYKTKEELFSQKKWRASQIDNIRKEFKLDSPYGNKKAGGKKLSENKKAQNMVKRNERLIHTQEIKELVNKIKETTDLNLKKELNNQLKEKIDKDESETPMLNVNQINITKSKTKNKSAGSFINNLVEDIKNDN